MGEVPKIEGISPDMLWSFLIVLVGLCALFLTYDKVAQAVQNIRKRRKKPDEDQAARMAEEISERVTETISQQLDDIRDKLATDKSRLDAQERRISSLETSQMDVKEGFSVLCTGLIAALNHELHNGNADEMMSAIEKITKYLTHRN